MKTPSQILVVGCGALIASGLFAVGDDEKSRAADKPEQALTSAEIVAKPRPKTVKTPVPADTGVYIGSGVYANRGRMNTGGFSFTYWEPDKLGYDEIVELCAKEQIGNTLQYSVNIYICNKQNDGNEAFAELVKALYNYGASSLKYYQERMLNE